MAIVTLAQVKEYLAIQTSNTKYDDFLNGTETVTGMITLVSQELEDAIQNDIETTEHDVTIDGSGKSLQPLPYWPIIILYGGDDAAKLASLQYRGTATDSWADLLTNINLVFYDTDRPWALTLLDSNTFPAGDKNLRVKYYSGYSTIPSDIQLAVIERVALKWLESKGGEGRLGVDIGGGGSGGGPYSNANYNDNQKRWDAVVRKYGRCV